jgi:hypothetical protein
MIDSYTFEERAAIIQYHGGYSRNDAEHLARYELFKNVMRRPTQIENYEFEKLGWSRGKRIRFLNR